MSLNNKSTTTDCVTHRRKAGKVSVPVILVPVEIVGSPEGCNSGLMSRLTVLTDAQLPSVVFRTAI
jgi:hypothetical protein